MLPSPYSDFIRVDLPALTQVQGAFNIQTSGTFDCSAFDTLHKNKAIRGNYHCQGSATKPGPDGSSPSSSNTGGKSSKTGAAVHFEANIPMLISGSSLIAGLLHFLL